MHRLSVSFWVAAVVALAGGCTANGGDEGMLVLENVHAGTGCTTNASNTELHTSAGSLELLLPPSGYLFIAQVDSKIVAAVGTELQHTIELSGANIDITFPGSTLFSDAELADLKSGALTHFRQPVSAPVSPNGGISDAGFDLITPELTQKVFDKSNLANDPITPFRLEALATFTLDGTMSGERVTSQPFTYGITFGNRLTVNVVGACSAVPSGFTARTGYDCNAAQDGVIDCCFTGGMLSVNSLVCPAVAPAMN